MSEHKRPIIIAASTALVKAGRALLIQRAFAPAKGLYTLPGGKLHYGETLEACARRELLEETGFLAEHLRYLAPVELIHRQEAAQNSKTTQNNETMDVYFHAIIHAFACDKFSGSVHMSQEVADHRWVSLDEAASLPCTEGLGAILAKALG